MQKLNYLLLFSSFLLLISVSSCTIEDSCATVVCLNGGTCDEGVCDCPSGFSGENCENVLSVQERLDSGEITPFELYSAGVSLDSLYGKFYEGGLLFYLDAEDEFPNFEGLIVAENSLNNQENIQWGCNGTDIEALDNIETLPDDPENEVLTSTKLSDGVLSTIAITIECSSPEGVASLCSAAEINGQTDWYLPSRGELYFVYKNLYLEGKGNFTGGQRYWTSTEFAFNRVWTHIFNTGSQSPDFKASNLVQVLPVRIY